MASKANCVSVLVEFLPANELGENVGWVVFWLYLAHCDDFALNKLLYEKVPQFDALLFL